jgi:hypothetical protein
MNRPRHFAALEEERLLAGSISTLVAALQLTSAKGA